MTDKPHIERLRDVIRELHGVPTQHVESVPITETHQGQIVWDGVVEVFGRPSENSPRLCLGAPDRRTRQDAAPYSFARPARCIATNRS